MEVTGQIVFIDPTRVPTESKPDFKTRSFAIQQTTEVNFDTVVKDWGFQTIKPEILEGLGIGDTVKVVFNIRCNRSKRDANKFTPTPQNPNNESVFASLDCVKLDVIERSKNHVNATSVSSEPAAATIADPSSAAPTIIPQPSGEPPVIEGEVQVWNNIKGIWEAPIPF